MRKWDIRLQRSATAAAAAANQREDQSNEESMDGSPSGPALRSLDNSYRSRRMSGWSYLPRIYWRMAGWDMGNIALFALPTYILLFAVSMF